MGVKYSYQKQYPFGLELRDDRLIRTGYASFNQIEKLRENVKHRKYDLIMFFIDRNEELDRYQELCNRIVANETIVCIFKKHIKPTDYRYATEGSMLCSSLQSEIRCIEKDMLISYGVDLEIGKKILMVIGNGSEIVAEHYLQTMRTFDGIIMINPKLSVIGLSTLSMYDQDLKIPIIVTNDITYDNYMTEILKSISRGDITYLKKVSSKDLQLIDPFDIREINKKSSVWDQVAELITNIIKRFEQL